MALEDYMVKPQYLYLKVTMDKFELPIAVADTPADLARMCGVNLSSVWRGLNKSKYGKGCYRSVRIDK